MRACVCDLLQASATKLDRNISLPYCMLQMDVLSALATSSLELKSVSFPHSRPEEKNRFFLKDR